MKIYDTLTQKVKEFVPREGNKVKMYVCGPTVQDYPHLGHARCYITWDVIYRYLKFKGYDVTYVRNIIDVDDKIINRAKRHGVPPQSLAETYGKEFDKAMDSLNILRPDFEPKASETVEDTIEFIKKLEETGYAYKHNGNVYFKVSKYKKYGKLSKEDLDNLLPETSSVPSGTRGNQLDFVLWKSVKSDDEGEIYWDSPWGKGRPSKHIECSTIIKKYLGEQIDIFAGGHDLIFPHHENAKAQIEAISGNDLANFWMHNGLLKKNQEKMTKTAENMLTIEDLLPDYDATTLRYFILTYNYKDPVEFDEKALNAARAAVRRLKKSYWDDYETSGPEKIKIADELTSRIINEIVKTGQIPFHQLDDLGAEYEDRVPIEIMDKIIKRTNEFNIAMSDDFNTSKAIQVLFEVAFQSQIIRESEAPKRCAFCAALISNLALVLGLDLKGTEAPKKEVPSEVVSNLIQTLISIRQNAIKDKNHELAESIKKQLEALGVTISDKEDE